MKNSLLKKSGILMMLVICSVVVMSKYGQDKEKSKTIDNKEKISLNHIAMSADEYDIDDVKFSENAEENVHDYIEAYKVQTLQYKDSDIRKIVKNAVNTKVDACKEEDKIKVYELSNGGEVTYYEKSGTISYSFSEMGNNKSSNKNISIEKLKQIATDFIEKSNLFDMSELEFYKGGPSITTHDSKGEAIVEYEVIYTKIPPKGIDGFDGTGPGIIVQIDCHGGVTGFVSIDKEIEKIKKSYPGKDIQEIEDDVINNNNVMIYSNEPVKKNLEVNDVEYVLYCDSVNEEQDYMIPHYRFKEKKNKNMDIVIPAIDNDYISFKKHK